MIYIIIYCVIGLIWSVSAVLNMLIEYANLSPTNRVLANVSGWTFVFVFLFHFFLWPIGFLLVKAFK